MVFDDELLERMKLWGGERVPVMVIRKSGTDEGEETEEESDSAAEVAP